MKTNSQKYRLVATMYFSYKYIVACILLELDGDWWQSRLDFYGFLHRNVSDVSLSWVKAKNKNKIQINTIVFVICVEEIIYFLLCNSITEPLKRHDWSCAPHSMIVSEPPPSQPMPSPHGTRPPPPLPHTHT